MTWRDASSETDELPTFDVNFEVAPSGERDVSVVDRASASSTSDSGCKIVLFSSG
jgi:hypothetical protein